MMLDCCVSSGKVASSAAINAKPSLVYGVLLVSASAACSVILKNGGTGGTEVIEIGIGNNAAVTPAVTVGTTQYVSFPKGVIFGTDIYATLAGTGAYCYVYYQQYGTI